MSSEVRLRKADIQAQLKALLRRRRDEHRHEPVALYGSGDEGPVEVDGNLWTVVPVRTELELRHALDRVDDDPTMVFLVDYDDRLPLDIACRLAGQKVHSVDRRSRLANLFGARKVAPGFAPAALVDVLLDELPSDLPPIGGTLLQPDDAWRRYLHVRLQLPYESRVELADLLVQAFRRPDDGRAFGRRRSDPLWTTLLTEAAAWFERTGGPAARVVWQAWIGGSPLDLVAWTIHLDAARRAQDRSCTTLLRQALRYAQGADEAWLDEATAGPLCGALPTLLEALDPREVQAVVQRAGAVFSDPDFAVARRASPWLPEGFEALQDELAAALGRVLGDPNALPEVLRTFDALEARYQAQTRRRPDRTAQGQQEVRAAGVRLATWLGTIERRPLPDAPGWTGMAALATWYDREGGWVDWAREVLRSHSTGHAGLDAALRPVLDRADDVRRDLDRRFAEATLAWYAAGKPATDVLPIERVTKDVVARFLGETPNRKLLVVLMDGMSVPAATRLVEARDGWAPVGWSPRAAHPGGSARMPPAVAALPTLTSTSRAAFFAGKADPRFGHEPEGDDPERFRKNPALHPFAGRAGPRLFLKPDLGSSRELSKQVLDALRDEEERVVAVVVNAIDDQLKGSDQVALDYEDPQRIPVLARLFQVARETERAVLLVSDHGHVPAQVLTGSRPGERTPDNGQRWRELAPGQAAQEGEVELPDGCWKPRGAAGVAVFWDERRCWGSSRFGAHGGLSLAEAVVPIRLLAPDWLHGVVQPPDDGLRTREQEQPGWWRLQLPASRTARPAPVVAQPTLFPSLAPKVTKEPAPEPPTDEAPRRHPLTAALEGTDRFKARVQDRRPEDVERALLYVDVLVAAGGAMSQQAFARAVGVKAHRLAGRIAQLGFLNADGYTVLEHDVSGDQVRLHLDRLKTQYGLA